MDFNCKEMRIFNSDRSTIGSVTLHHLVGLTSLAAPIGMTVVRDGVAYVTVTPGLGRNDAFEGFVFRIRGL